jgi:hypothetical protein
MVEKTQDLISMAEIAQLAGQRRATVGNWKSRHADFPTERGRNPRGPLYDRAEVVEWLHTTGRLVQRPAEFGVIERLFNDPSALSQMNGGDDPPLILVALALRKHGTAEQLQHFDGVDLDEGDEFIHNVIPLADGVIEWESVLAPIQSKVVEAISGVDPNSVAELADEVIDRFEGYDGAYLAPPSVRRLISGIAQPKGILYQPGPGLGQYFSDAASAGEVSAMSFFAQELTARGEAMARVNLDLHDLTATVASGDIYLQDAFPDLRADCIVSVPPWNQNVPQLAGMADDVRWVWGEPGPNDAYFAWIQHCLYHLAEGGRAVLAVPNSVLFERGRSGRIRQRIVKAGLLDAVISLPAGLFPGTSVRCAVLVFSKSRCPARETLMVDLSEAGKRSARTGLVVLDPQAIEQTVKVYRDWLAERPTTWANVAVATFDDLAANDFVIDPVRYQAIVDTAPDLEKTTRTIDALRQRLKALIDASRSADDPVAGHAGAETMSSVTEARVADLADVLAIDRGIPTQATTRQGGELPVLSVTDLRDGSAAQNFVDRADLRDYRLQIPEPGDVLVSIEGGTVGETLVLSEDENPFAPSQQVALIHVLDETRLDAWYLGAWLATEPAREQLRRLARGSRIQRIPIKELQSLVIPMPPVEIQRDIGEQFLAFQTAIGLHRKIATTLEQLCTLDLAMTFAKTAVASTARPGAGEPGLEPTVAGESRTPENP